MAEKNKTRVCPVCGKFEFEEPDCYDFCKVCGWCDDPLESTKAGYKGGYNRMTVEEYREAWKRKDPVCYVPWKD